MEHLRAAFLHSGGYCDVIPFQRAGMILFPDFTDIGQELEDK